MNGTARDIELPILLFTHREGEIIRIHLKIHRSGCQSPGAFGARLRALAIGVCESAFGARSTELSELCTEYICINPLFLIRVGSDCFGRYNIYALPYEARHSVCVNIDVVIWCSPEHFPVDVIKTVL